MAKKHLLRYSHHYKNREPSIQIPLFLLSYFLIIIINHALISIFRTSFYMGSNPPPFNLSIDTIEELLKNGFVQILIFVTIYYLINCDIFVAFIIFIVYFTALHLVENTHISDEIKMFKEMK